MRVAHTRYRVWVLFGTAIVAAAWSGVALATEGTGDRDVKSAASSFLSEYNLIPYAGYSSVQTTLVSGSGDTIYEPSVGIGFLNLARPTSPLGYFALLPYVLSSQRPDIPYTEYGLEVSFAFLKMLGAGGEPPPGDNYLIMNLTYSYGWRSIAGGHVVGENALIPFRPDTQQVVTNGFGYNYVLKAFGSPNWIIIGSLKQRSYDVKGVEFPDTTSPHRVTRPVEDTEITVEIGYRFNGSDAAP